MEPIAECIRFLKTPKDIRRAVSKIDEAKQIDAVGRSDSPALLPSFILGMDAGLRAGEARSLRHKNLELVRKDGENGCGRFIVGKSKQKPGLAELSRLPDPPA